MRKVICLSSAFMLTLFFASFAAAQDKPADKAQGPFNEAKSLIEQRRFDEAIVVLDEAIKISPEKAALYHQLGRAYTNKLYATNDSAFELKARAALQKAIELDPSFAEAHYVLGRIEFFKKQYEAAIADYERAIKADPALIKTYSEKWRAMLQRADFDKEIPKIRLEVEGLLKRTENREAILEAAATGYEFIADEQEAKRVRSMMLAEFPEGKYAEEILLNRLFEEKDNTKQAESIERFIARYPQNPNVSKLYGMLFSTRLQQPGTSDKRIIELGDAWVKAATSSAPEIVNARTTVLTVFAERRLELDRAQALADETVKMLDEMKLDSPLLIGPDPSKLEEFIRISKERARMARGFVLLRRGKLAEADKDLGSALERVIKQVDKNGYVLWKDMDLRRVSARPRVLWLAELYEAQGDYERAAKYLLAGYSEDERGNQFIRERLPVVYQKMGRSPSDVTAAIKSSESRYRAVTVPTMTSKEEDKKTLLANRIGTPAADFKVTGLDKKEIQWGDLKGKVVVLNFWATWCGPCVAEMPHLQKVVDQYKNEPEVFFLAISIDESRPAVRPFLEKNGYSMAAAYDINAAESYKIQGVPMTFIIDRNGVIQFRDLGFGGEGKDYIERMIWRIDELLKEKPAHPPADKDKGQKQN